MTEILFVTHAEVVIDPAVPVPEWGLAPRGRARHAAHAEALHGARFGALWSSPERKALEAAAILSDALALTVQVHAGLAENDRSATGYLPREAFEAAADAFFADPGTSFRGWETAQAAQGRIVEAIAAIASRSPENGPVAVVAHGGVGALLMAWLLDRPISRTFDQPGNGGGNCFGFDWPERKVLQPWTDIAPGRG